MKDFTDSTLTEIIIVNNDDRTPVKVYVIR